jgi:multicomponent Na+:H+ antiporter subunit G
MREVSADVLLCVGVGIELIACLGILAMRDAYDALHFTSPTVLGALLIAAAILVRDGFSLVADKALLTAAFLLVAGPLLTHATARSARLAERGDWTAGVGSEIEVEEP